jgi:hypothetical protein
LVENEYFLKTALMPRPHGLAEGATRSFGESREPFSKGSLVPPKATAGRPAGGIHTTGENDEDLRIAR